MNKLQYYLRAEKLIKRLCSKCKNIEVDCGSGISIGKCIHIRFKETEKRWYYDELEGGYCGTFKQIYKKRGVK